MSNSYLNQFQQTYEKDTVTIFGSAVIGASGAVGTVKGGGVQSVTKNVANGNYTIQLSERFNRFLGLTAGVLSSTISGIANVQVLGTPATFQADVKSTGQVTVQCIDYAGAAANPPSGSVLSFRITCRNSSVGPYDG